MTSQAHLFCVAGAVVSFAAAAIDAKHTTQLIALGLLFVVLRLFL